MGGRRLVTKNRGQEVRGEFDQLFLRAADDDLRDFRLAIDRDEFSPFDKPNGV